MATKVKHPAVFLNIGENAKIATWRVTNEFKNDSVKKKYIPFDKGGLAKSARVIKPIRRGNTWSGEVTFNTSYARRQYYEHKTKSKWGEKAWKDNSEKYDKMIGDIMGGKV